MLLTEIENKDGHAASQKLISEHFAKGLCAQVSYKNPLVDLNLKAKLDLNIP
jgi:hypothetical protein